MKDRKLYKILLIVIGIVLLTLIYYDFLGVTTLFRKSLDLEVNKTAFGALTGVSFVLNIYFFISGKSLVSEIDKLSEDFRKRESNFEVDAMIEAVKLYSDPSQNFDYDTMLTPFMVLSSLVNYQAIEERKKVVVVECLKKLCFDRAGSDYARALDLYKRRKYEECYSLLTEHEKMTNLIITNLKYSSQQLGMFWLDRGGQNYLYVYYYDIKRLTEWSLVMCDYVSLRDELIKPLEFREEKETNDDQVLRLAEVVSLAVRKLESIRVDAVKIKLKLPDYEEIYTSLNELNISFSGLMLVRKLKMNYS